MRTLLILLAIITAAAFVGLRTGSLGERDQPIVAASDEDDEDEAECGDTSGSGGNSGQGGDDCDDDEDHSGHGGGGDEDDAEGAAPRPGAPSGAEVGVLTVRIVGRSFQPAVLTIAPGQSVTFINTDDDEHTATGIGFDTGVLAPGASATVTIADPGEFAYVCRFHSEMRGTIVAAGAASPEASPGATPVASPKVSPASAASPAAAGAEASVEIIDFAFAEAELRVRPGTTVVWTNTGEAAHTVSSDFADSGLLEPGQRFRHTFTEAGDFPYICSVHPEMQARVIVEPNAP